MRVNEHIRYQPDDKPPPLVTLSVASQGVVIAVSNTAALVTIFVLASGGSEGYLSWALFASLIIAGAITALHAAKLGRIAPGYILLMGPAAPFMAVCVLAITQGGFALMSNLIVAASLVQFALAFWLAQLRRIITPVVSGVAFMLISASAMPIAIARLENVPADASPLAGPAVGVAALIVAAILMLRATGVLRLFAIPVTIAAGWVVAIPLGVFDFRSALDAPWFGLPQFSAWPGFSSIRLEDFLALLPVFLIVSIVVGIKASNEGAAIQQVSWRIPRAVDFRGVQGTLNVSGVGILLAGIAGTLPPLNYLPSSIALINFTAVAARRAGFVMGAVLIAIALLPKIVAVLLTIPRPVTGVILMIVMGLLFVEGIRTVLQDGFSQQKAIIVGLALSIGIGLQTHNILAEPLGSIWGVAFGNSVVVGILAAVLMSLLLEITASRRRRFETELDISALPDIQEFLRGLASKMRWSEESIAKLSSAGEETLSTMLELRDDYDVEKIPRLVIIARPGGRAMEMEFLAVFSEENIEDRISYMSEQAEAPDVSELSFRLLRHYASSVRHRKYHGIDIVTVQVDA
ncbi:MAG: hypothetical protein F4Y63_05900 [Chloroflexi bacterium]|nr:hypothetical protein [Chloroflexota bacterium]MYK61161.1 hypothetical protein [Chloroflexota bacterium]